MKNSRIALIGLAAFAIGGCTSLNNAGTASYSVEPMVIDGKPVCCKVSVQNGKEIASIDATIKVGEYSVVLKERGIAAFKGQELAAGAARDGVKVVETGAAIAGGVLAAPMIVPLVAGAVTAGTVPAAVAGAAVGVGAAKAAQQ